MHETFKFVQAMNLEAARKLLLDRKLVKIEFMETIFDKTLGQEVLDGQGLLAEDGKFLLLTLQVRYQLAKALRLIHPAGPEVVKMLNLLEGDHESLCSLVTPDVVRDLQATADVLSFLSLMINTYSKAYHSWCARYSVWKHLWTTVDELVLPTDFQFTRTEKCAPVVRCKDDLVSVECHWLETAVEAKPFHLLAYDYITKLSRLTSRQNPGSADKWRVFLEDQAGRHPKHEYPLKLAKVKGCLKEVGACK